jgi:hypothetical protein
MVKTEERMTDLESVKRYLEKKGEESASMVDDELPREFLGHLVVGGLHLDLIQPGRIVFSMKIPPHLLVRILLFSSFYLSLIITLMDFVLFHLFAEFK